MMEKIPGGPDQPVIPGGEVTLAELNALMGEIAPVADNISEKVGQQMLDLLQEIENTCANIEGIHQGSCGVLLDSIMGTVRKIEGKLQSGMEDGIRQVYSYMAAAGINPPTNQDVAYYKATGDLFYESPIDDPKQIQPIIDNTTPQPEFVGPKWTIYHPPQRCPDQPNPVNGLVCWIDGDSGDRIWLPEGQEPPGGGPGGWAHGSDIPDGYFDCLLPPPPPPSDNCIIIKDYINSLQQTACTWFCNDSIQGSSGNDSTCPPGYHPNPNLNSNAGTSDLILPPQGLVGNRRPLSGPSGGSSGQNPIWQLVGPINNTNGQLSGDGRACIYPAKNLQQSNITPGTVNYPYNDPVFPVQAWNPMLPPPPPTDAWDLVNVLPPVVPTWPQYNGQYYALVPHGYQIFTDPENGNCYAAPRIPFWACKKGEVGRWKGTADAGGGDGGVIPPPGGNNGGNGEPACVPDDNAVCPVPGPVDCGKPAGMGAVNAPPNGDGFCDSVQGYQDAMSAFAGKLSDLIGMGTGEVETSKIADVIVGMIIGQRGAAVPNLVNRFGKWVQGFIDSIKQGMPCDVAALGPIVTLNAIIRFMDKWTGVVPEQYTEFIAQVTNFVCHVILPGVSEADRAFLDDQIDQKEWECWVKAAGHRVPEAQKVRDGSRLRLNPREAIHAAWREYITPDRKDKLMRSHGAIKPDEQKELEDIEQFWPTWSDMIEFMTKDAFDQNTVDTFRLDDGFDNAYTDKAKKLAKGAGISDELMKYKWRSHWRNLGPEMMIRAGQRLRPGRVPDNVAVSQKDLRQALQQQDIMPYWIDRLIRLAQKLIPEGDMISLYMRHQFDDDELAQRLKDYGYGDDDIMLQVASLHRQREVADYQKAGYPSIRQAVNLYSQCLIDGNTFEQVVSNQAYSQEQEQHSIEAADIMRDVNLKRLAIKTVTRSFKLGLIDENDATIQLNEAGVDPSCIPGLVRGIRHQRDKGSKELSASQLCKLRKQGIISAEQQALSLSRLRFTYEDVVRIVESCTFEIEQAAIKQAEKKAAAEAKKQAAADKKAAKATKPKKALP